jgi:hypothetical protein
MEHYIEIIKRASYNASSTRLRTEYIHPYFCIQLSAFNCDQNCAIYRENHRDALRFRTPAAEDSALPEPGNVGHEDHGDDHIDDDDVDDDADDARHYDWSDFDDAVRPHVRIHGLEAPCDAVWNNTPADLLVFVRNTQLEGFQSPKRTYEVPAHA